MALLDKSNLFGRLKFPLYLFSILCVHCSQGPFFIKSISFPTAGASTSFPHYENTPIQIYRKFHLQKLKIFR